MRREEKPAKRKSWSTTGTWRLHTPPPDPSKPSCAGQTWHLSDGQWDLLVSYNYKQTHTTQQQPAASHQAKANVGIIFPRRPRKHIYKRPSFLCVFLVGRREDIIIIIHTRPAALCFLSVKFSCLQLTTRNAHTHESSSNNNNKFRPERRAFQIESHPSSVVISEMTSNYSTKEMERIVRKCPAEKINK